MDEEVVVLDEFGVEKIGLGVDGVEIGMEAVELGVLIGEPCLQWMGRG
jgi:hypothetical protein